METGIASWVSWNTCKKQKRFLRSVHSSCYLHPPDSYLNDFTQSILVQTASLRLVPSTRYTWILMNTITHSLQTAHSYMLHTETATRKILPRFTWHRHIFMYTPHINMHQYYIVSQELRVEESIAQFEIEFGQNFEICDVKYGWYAPCCICIHVHTHACTHTLTWFSLSPSLPLPLSHSLTHTNTTQVARFNCWGACFLFCRYVFMTWTRHVVSVCAAGVSLCLSMHICAHVGQFVGVSLRIRMHLHRCRFTCI